MSSETKLPVVLMLGLTLMALLVAGIVMVEHGDVMQAALFTVLAALAGWQAFHWPQ